MVNKHRMSLRVPAADHHEHVATRLTRMEVEKLDLLVESGEFLNRADAVRTAVRQMLSGVSVLHERRIPFAQAKEEILQFLDSHETAYPSDIATALELDYDVVLRALDELRNVRKAELE